MNSLAVGAVLGATGVTLGAFAAHALRERLPTERRAIFEVGVRYQLVHALVLVALSALPEVKDGPAALLFTVGVVLFSGSLYALALGGPRGLGMLTPLGGLALIGGWGALAVGALGS